MNVEKGREKSNCARKDPTRTQEHKIGHTKTRELLRAAVVGATGHKRHYGP